MSGLTTLAIDTCTPHGSIALGKGSQLISDSQWDSSGSHSQVITEELENILKSGSLSLADLDQIVIGNGPGSFTGIRIGLNLAKGLAYSLDIPIIEYSSLHGFAEYALDQKLPVLSVVGAFRDLYYCATYQLTSSQQWKETMQPVALTAEEVLEKVKGEFCLVGNAAEDLNDELNDSRFHLQSGSDLSSARNLISIHSRNQDPSTQTKDWKQSAPLYVRASEAEEKLKNK